MALTGTLPLPLPAISQEGSRQLRAVPRGTARRGSLRPMLGDRCWLCHRVTGRSGAGQGCVW